MKRIFLRMWGALKNVVKKSSNWFFLKEFQWKFDSEKINFAVICERTLDLLVLVHQLCFMLFPISKRKFLDKITWSSHKKEIKNYSYLANRKRRKEILFILSTRDNNSLSESWRIICGWSLVEHMFFSSEFMLKHVPLRHCCLCFPFMETNSCTEYKGGWNREIRRGLKNHLCVCERIYQLIEIQISTLN